MLKYHSQAIHENLDLLRNYFLKIFKSLTSQWSKISEASISSALNFVFINYKNLYYENNGENLYI